MRDHNSLHLNEAMGAVFTALLKDFEALTPYCFKREAVRVNRLLRTSGRPGLLSFLEKHHLVLLGWLKTGKLNGDVRFDKDGYPLFLNALWKDLPSVTAVANLRQAMCLLRKWREDAVPKGQSTLAFLDRMRETKALDYGIIDQIASHLSAVIGDDDMALSCGWYPLITSGARAVKTPVLNRIDTMCRLGDGQANDVYTRDGFRLLPQGKDSINRLVEVPKDWTKNRLVFAEPSHLMNTQQVCRMWLECASRFHEGARRISFQDQEFQRRSLRMDARSSIDLSDASDHIDLKLVFRFLRKYPLLRSTLFRCRSWRTTVSGDTVALRCFGTMGNATTFTVMSIFLACLTREAEFHCFGYTKIKPRVSTVFGDDIVCDDVIAGTVCELLSRCGLVPNQRKTFIGTAFRESCGLDLFNGQDITPVYIKSVQVRSRQDIVRSIQQSNTLYERHYWNCAAVIASFTGRVLSVNVDDASLSSHTNCVSTKGCTYNHNLQRYESKYRPRPKGRVATRDSHLDLQYAFYHGSRVSQALSPERRDG